MEIKDLNNNLTSIQAMFAKAVTNIGVAQGSGFANLLGDASTQLSEIVGKTSEFVDNKVGDVKNESVDKKSETVKVVEDKQSEVDNKSVSKKDKIAKKEGKDVVSEGKEDIVAPAKQKKLAEDSAEVVVSVQNADIANVQEAVENIELSSSPEETLNIAVVVKPEGEAFFVELPVDAVSEFVENATIIVAKDGKVLVPEGVDLGKVAELPAVEVFDETLGQTMMLRGEELIDVVERANQNNSLLVVDNDVAENILSVFPAKIENVNERDYNFASIDNVVSEQQDLTMVDQKVVEQAKFLDAKMGDGKKIKVDVVVEEEGFSYADDKTLVQDTVLLDEVINSVKEQNGEKSVKSQFGVQTVNPQVNTASANNIGVISNSTVVSANVMIQSAAEMSQTTVVDGVSSVSGGVGTVLNGGVVLENKFEGVNKALDANSKDVYKGMGKEVVEQVKVNITKSAVKGVDKIDIQLKPKELGNIEIKMQISKDGKLQAHIVSGRIDTMEVLQREVNELERAFNEAGFETDEGSFSFSFRGDESGSEKERNAELRNFIGNVLEQDSEDILGGNDNLLNWNPAQGLNIRV